MVSEDVRGEEQGALLIIDDEPEVLAALQRYFRRKYAVRIATSAEEGVRVLKESPVNVVISDQRMPGMKGTEFFRKIKEEHPDVVRMILTGYSDIDAVIAAINDGNIFRYITKPWNPEELDGIVREAFERYSLIRENRRLIRDLQDANVLLEGRVQERTLDLARTNGELQQELVERRKAEEQVRRERDRAQQYLDVAGVMMLVLNENGAVSLINGRGCEILGYEEGEIVGTNWFDRFVPAGSRDRLGNIFREIMLGRTDAWEYAEETVLTKGGQEKTIAWHNAVLRDESGMVVGVLSSGEDVTERRIAEAALQESEERFKTVINSVQAGILLVDASTRTIAEANPAALHMLGRLRNEVVGEVCHRFVCPSEKGTCPVLDLGKEVENAERTLLTAEGETIPILKNVTSVEMRGKRYLIESFLSIAERKKMEDLMRQMAYHDPLTGLPNRKLLDDRISVALPRALRENGMAALMMMDLDRFKGINDSLGHVAGDELLKEVGSRLQGVLRKSDTVARVGGDEFVLLVTDMKTRADAAVIAEKVIDSFRKPFLLNASDVVVTTSIGIAVCPDDGSDGPSLLKHADAALYRSKDEGRNSWRFYSEPSVNLPAESC